MTQRPTETLSNWWDLDQVEARVCEIASEQLGIVLEKVRPDSRIVQDLHCDSLDLVELLMEVEDEFDVSIGTDLPVGKLIFARSEFRIGDLAELAFLNQGTGKPVRGSGWFRKREVETTPPPSRDFAQLGGRTKGAPPTGAARWEALELDLTAPTFRRVIDGMVCVQVPARQVTLGSDDPNLLADERPQHVANLDSFLIDIEPVSVIAFCRFLNSIDASDDEFTNLVSLLDEDDRTAQLQFERIEDRWLPRPNVGRQPVVLVSWFAANAYSLWANSEDWREFKTAKGFLPTEAQWESVAAGAFDASEKVLAGQHVRGEAYLDGQMPIADVDLSLGVSSIGLRHMSGTVWHWCRDWYDADFYDLAAATESNPVNLEPTGIRSERGGSWVGPLELCRPTYRRGRVPSARGRCLGFRCVSQSIEK